MKKIITLILLLVFCIEPTCWATEIIVGADGQARYADGLESMVKEEVIVENKNGGFNVSQSAIKTKAELEEMVSPYKKKNLKLVKNAPKTINFTKGFEKYRDQSGSLKTFQLQDGDYVEWSVCSKSVQYAAEFHKDASLMGIIKIKKINEDTIVFYEYRVDSKEDKIAKLKHVMVVYQDVHKAAFIYAEDNNLRCCLYDGKTYAIDLPNMPCVCEVVDSLQIRSFGAEALSNMAEVGSALVMAPFALLQLPMILFSIALYILYLPVGIFMSIKTRDTSWLTLDFNHY